MNSKAFLFLELFFIMNMKTLQLYFMFKDVVSCFSLSLTSDQFLIDKALIKLEMEYGITSIQHLFYKYV